MTDIEVLADGYKLRARGLKETARALEKAGADTSDMKTLMHDIGEIVVKAAMPHVPRVSGKLASTIRAGRGKTKAVVRAGGKRAPYAPIVHYGYRGGLFKKGRPRRAFLADAITREQSAIVDKLSEGLGEIFDRNNLENNL
ncbi:HK97 gp10 family phage protein [Arcanobacterium canis]